LRRLQQQPRPGQCNERVQCRIELLGLLFGHLQAVLDLALLAEQSPICCEAGVQRTQLPVAVIADEVEVFERLRGCDLGLEEQRLAMRRLLRAQVELVGARGGNGLELFLESGRHGARFLG
jgi:hypothetical protein